MSTHDDNPTGAEEAIAEANDAPDEPSTGEDLGTEETAPDEARGESNNQLESNEPVPGNGDDDVDPDAETIANIDQDLRADPDEETFAASPSESDKSGGGLKIPEPSEVEERAVAEDREAEDDDEAAGQQNGIDADEISEEVVEEPSEAETTSLGDLTGRMLSGRYKLVDRIGGGGMGEVYRAEHALIKKQVAIKLLYPELAGESVIERFRREAQASAHIDHPNICASTDFGETEDGIFYLVMEYLDGETLDQVLEQDGEMEPTRAIHIARQICAALEQADELDIIHRDLKPENVMLVRRGSDEDFVKLLDFGIARVRMGQEAKLTQTGMVFGTPNFMSPEQAAGDPMDHRADLYAVGLLLFQMVAGRPPFQAERGSQVMAMHVSQEPPKPSTVADSDIPARLERLILELLEKEPENRPDSATDVRERLDELYLELEGVRRGRPADRSMTSVDRTQQIPDRSALELGNDSGILSDWASLRVPWPLAASAALLAVVIGAGGALGIDAMFSTKADDAAPSPAVPGSSVGANLGPLEREHREFLERPPVRRAMEAYRSGSNQTAIERLRELETPTESQPHLQHQLGRLYADNGDWTKSMQSYKRSLDANSQFLSDPELINDVFTAFQLDSKSVAGEARDILGQFIHRDRIKRRLVDLAWKDDQYLSRKRAHELLREKGVVARLPAWERLSIELRHSMGCDEHRQVIERLVQLGDPRGLRVLEMYADFPKSGCGRANQQDCYGCIRGDLKEAISALEAERARESSNHGAGASGEDAGPKSAQSGGSTPGAEPKGSDVQSSSKSSP